MKEAKRLLSGENYYTKLDIDPSGTYKSIYLNRIEEAFTFNTLNKKEYRFLTVDKPVMIIFYYLPKIHKSLHNPPGRPIIAGIGSLINNLSQYVDRHLQNFVVKLDSYLKDTTSLIRDIYEWNADFHYPLLMFRHFTLTYLMTRLYHPSKNF